MDNSKPRHNNDHLGVNKMGKNIRKSPLHQPNFANNPNRQQPQPQVYNISKNDFRSVVQQLTGSPSREALPRPPQNPPKPQSTRLQKIRPAPLTQINRPPVPAPGPVPAQGFAPPHHPGMAPPLVPYNNSYARPAQYGQPSPTMMQPMAPGDTAWGNTAESPISAYMRYLQTSIMDPSPNTNYFQPHNQSQSQYPGQGQAQPTSSGLLPTPAMPPSPRVRGPAPPLRRPRPPMPGPPPPMHASAPPMGNLPSPRFFDGPNPHMHPNVPSQQMNFPGPMPSPASQFLLPSPSGYMNLLSPRSPYPVLSPGVQFPPPLTPNFSFSPLGQSGILGPGPQPPLSPGLVFPLSPSGFFPLSSPRWRDQ